MSLGPVEIFFILVVIELVVYVLWAMLRDGTTFETRSAA